MPPKRLALGVWVVLLVACAAIISRTPFRTDMGAFLPHDSSLAQQVLTGQVTGGAASHIILLDISGAPVPVITALSEDLAMRLRQQPAFIDVLNGDDASFAKVQAFVWRNRYLLSPAVTTARFTEAGLHAALVNDLGLLGSDMGPLIQQSLPSDPTGEALNLLSQLTTGKAPQSQDNVWVSVDGTSALLLVHTAAPGFDIDAQQQALTLINADFAAAKSKIPDAQTARLQASGPGVFAIHTRDITKSDVKHLSMLASAGALGLLFFAYRSPLVILLGALPVASGAIAAIAAVSLAFGFVHGITLGFGVTLIGESLDYAIYLFTQTSRDEQASDTLARIWPTLRLGVLTSAVGFSAMLFSNFVGFAQLGLFSIVGLLAAAGVTRFVLPQLVPANFFAAGARAISQPLRAVMARRRPLRWLVAAVLLLSAAALLTHKGGLWDKNLAGMSPIPAADMALNQRLRHDLGVPDSRFFGVYQAGDEQQALAASEALAARLNLLVTQHQLGGFDVPSAILPSDKTQRARQAALPDAATLQASFTQAQAGMPFRSDIFAPFFDAVAAARAAPLITAASLPPALALRLESMLIRHGTGWVVMVPLRGVSNPAVVAKALAAAGVPGLALVDLNHESGQLLHTFQRQAKMLALSGSIAILILLLAGLRSVKRVVAVAAPLAAAVLMTAALLTLDGGKLSIFMVVGFLLIVAVGSNYCLFFAREEADAASWQRAIASIMLANLCTVSAYGLMAFSRIPVLHDIGVTVAIGTFLSLICAAIFSAGGPETC